MKTKFLTDGPKGAAIHVLLAHGSGAPMTSPFMAAMAGRLATGGLCVHRFEFEYMAAQREGSTRRPPPRAEALVASYQQAVADWGVCEGPPAQLLIGGKSLGGRVASLTASALYQAGVVSGLICLGYPFHPPNQPAKLRTSHLRDLVCPALIVQGTRDAFGSRDEVEGYELSNSIELAWIGDGDHDLAPRVRSGTTPEAARDEAAASVLRFAAAVAQKSKCADGAPKPPGRAPRR